MMGLENKDYIIDSNTGEKLEIKYIKEEMNSLDKEIAPKFRGIKKTSQAMLLSAMLATSTPAIDTSKLPHYAGLDDWTKKHVHVKVTRSRPRTSDYGDYTDVYTSDYYEKYNKQAQRLEYSPYRPNTYFNVVDGYMRYFGKVNYKLVDTRKVNFSKSFLKRNDLDKVVININGETFVTRPKFLELDFEPKGRKGHLVYGMGKKIVLVYVQYLDKIQVLGSIYQGEYYEENHHNVYSISVGREKYKKELNTILKLFHCNYRHCKIKTYRDGNKDFYKHGHLIGKVENFGDKKLIIKIDRGRQKLVAKILERGDKEFIIDNNNNIISQFSGYKKINIRLRQIDANLKLFLK